MGSLSFAQSRIENVVSKGFAQGYILNSQFRRRCTMSQTTTTLPQTSLAQTSRSDGRRKHVLDLDDFGRDEIGEILETTFGMKEVLGRAIKQVPALRGKTVVNMFFEDSTRTRISFELAAKALSANVVAMTSKGSSVETGASLLDTMRTLQALGADII